MTRRAEQTTDRRRPARPEPEQRVNFRAPGDHQCKHCNCTDSDGCFGGCYWVDWDETVCSACVGRMLDTFVEKVDCQLPQLTRPGAKPSYTVDLPKAFTSLEIEATPVNRQRLMRALLPYVKQTLGDATILVMGECSRCHKVELLLGPHYEHCLPALNKAGGRRL